MLLLKELGLVLALACTIGVTTFEIVHTAHRLWEKLEGVISMIHDEQDDEKI